LAETAGSLPERVAKPINWATRWQTPADWAPILLLLMVALLLRLANLGGKSLWIDEGFSIHEAKLPSSAIWAGVNEPNHPPLYYLALHYWPSTQTEFSARLPSALASVAGVAVLYLIARRLSNRRVALASAAILAVSPLDIWYAQEARMFALATLFILVAALGMILESRLGAAMMFFGLTAGLYTYFAVVPLWLGLGAAWLAWRCYRSQKLYPAVLWLIASAAASLAFLPLWPKLLGFMGRLGGVFGVGAFLKRMGLSTLPGWIVGLLLAVLVIGVFAGTVVAVRVLEGRRVRWLPPVILGGFILATALTPVPRLYSLKRFVVIGWPYVILVLALLLVGRAWLRGLAFAAILAVSLAASVVSIFFIPKTDFRSAVAYLNTHVHQGDVVWMTGKSELYTYRFYGPISPGGFGGPVDLEAFLASDSRVWLIVDCPRCGAFPDQIWLDRVEKVKKIVHFQELELRQYEPEG